MPDVDWGYIPPVTSKLITKREQGTVKMFKSNLFLLSALFSALALAQNSRVLLTVSGLLHYRSFQSPQSKRFLKKNARQFLRCNIYLSSLMTYKYPMTMAVGIFNPLRYRWANMYPVKKFFFWVAPLTRTYLRDFFHPTTTVYCESWIPPKPRAASHPTPTTWISSRHLGLRSHHQMLQRPGLS